ncbi:hypothetical protein QJS10_CPA06g01586 [Acorus calamus]|uniref:Uncharacterized protein n=1 Tax=Acorus calamus TaxID=4465 RepID=A0AAV9EKY4_ACOCL|nr:hypothetical protein QJS10_CPA06g01586 [Acorus calamus]
MGGEIGLVRMANILKIDISCANPHQAGHDSLITSKVFFVIKRKYKLNENQYQGCLVGNGPGRPVETGPKPGPGPRPAGLLDQRAWDGSARGKKGSGPIHGPKPDGLAWASSQRA